jgi:hypothetical protein
MTGERSMDTRMIAASIAATVALAATSALAAPATAQQAQGLTSQYAGWAGSAENAQSLVNGLRNGTSIMIVTREPGRRVSLAGFTPSRSMSDSEVSEALASARRELSRLGIQRPTAEQIQAALIGGEVESQGRVVSVRGQVDTGPVASR